MTEDNVKVGTVETHTHTHTNTHTHTHRERATQATQEVKSL